MTLVYQRKDAGYYYTEWNANGLPSGVYFYKTNIAGVVETKRMILMK